MLDNNDTLKFQLETLANCQPSDIDNPEFEVVYKTNEGHDYFSTVCCIELAYRSLERIVELERELIQAGEAAVDAEMQYYADQQRAEE